MICPNKNHPEFKALVEKYGENLAYYYWALGEKNGVEEQSSTPIYQENKIPSVSYATYNANKFDKTKEVEKILDKDDPNNGDYKDKQSDKIYTSVSNVIKTIQTRPYTATYTPGQHAADVKWHRKDPSEEQLFRELSITPINKQQFQELVDLQYNIGIGKGLLMHAMEHDYIEKSAKSAQQVKDIKNEYGIDIPWLTEGKIKAIIEKTGTDYYSPEGTDKIHSEKIIGNTEIGWFGTVDLMIDHGDNFYSLFDLKTGQKFNKFFEDSFFKYGRTSAGFDAFDTPRNRAKLQLMLYAFIMKLEDPNARFRNLNILYIKNQYSIGEEDPFKKVNVAAFLEIIQKTLQNAEDQTIWNKLKAKPHFAQLFDAAAYSAGANDDFMAKHPKASSSDLVKYKMLQLQGLIMWDSSVRNLDQSSKRLIIKKENGVEVTKDELADRRAEIAKLMEEIIELKKDPSVHMSVTEANMGYLDRYLGSQSYSTNPYVQMYYKELSKAKQISRDHNEKNVAKHDYLLKQVIDYMGLKPISRLVGGVDRQKLFEFAFISDKNHVKRLKVAGEPEFEALHQTQKDYLNFVNESISGVFEEKFADRIDSSKDSDGKIKLPLAQRIVTYRDWRGKKDVAVSNLDLHNKMYSINNTDSSKRPFKYYAGFFPKFAPQIDDIARMHGGYFSKDVVKYLWNRYTTNYFENVFNQWGNEEEAIPMKFLDQDDIVDNENYTMNLELAYKSFIKHHIYKAQMDEVYSMAQAMKIYLDAEKQKIIAANSGGDAPEHIKNMIGWFENSINLHILGRKQTKLPISSRSSGKIIEGRYQQFNWAKFLRSMKQFFAGPTMWLKPLAGIPNFVFASLISLKEGIKTSLGISTSNAKFGIAELASGFYEAFKMTLWDGKSNEQYRHNKAYLLMEKFGYLPDNHDSYTTHNELMTARNQLFTSRSMMMFHSMPEEVIATALFVAQLKNMKFTKADGTVTSMWDAYDNPTTTLSDGSTVTHIVWNGGVRGKQNMSNDPTRPDYQDVEGLTIDEINAVKFLYEKIHGGYRGDERVAAEYYVMGELYLQFKKYMPAILKNVWASKGIRQTQGNLEESIDEHGNKVLKWKPQVIEGRYKIIAGLLFNFLSIKQNKTDGAQGNFFSRLLGLEYEDSQGWKNLSEAQKEDVKDFALTTVMWVLLLIGYMKLWDRDEQPTEKKIYDRITNDFAGNVNPMEMIKNIKNAYLPSSINRAYQLLSGITETSWSMLLWSAGYDDAALTKEGNFRGSANIKRNTHFIAPIYDIMLKGENSDLFKEYMK